MFCYRFLDIKGAHLLYLACNNTGTSFLLANVYMQCALFSVGKNKLKEMCIDTFSSCHVTSHCVHHSPPFSFFKDLSPEFNIIWYFIRNDKLHMFVYWRERVARISEKWAAFVWVGWIVVRWSSRISDFLLTCVLHEPTWTILYISMWAAKKFRNSTASTLQLDRECNASDSQRQSFCICEASYFNWHWICNNLLYIWSLHFG